MKKSMLLFSIIAVRAGMLVTTSWLAKRLNDSQTVVLHVARERGHYEEGHIPGARFVAWAGLTATRDGAPNELPPVAELQNSSSDSASATRRGLSSAATALGCVRRASFAQEGINTLEHDGFCVAEVYDIRKRTHVAAWTA